MGLSNNVVIALSVFLVGFLVVLSKRKWIKKVWLRRMVQTALIMVTITMVFVTILFPDLPSVKTTGDSPYASKIFELTDPSRQESFSNNGSPRKLSLLVYYPTKISEEKKCPLIVFSHGGISFKQSNISLFEELASHGYVVVSIDHTYHAIVTKIDGKSVYIDSAYLKEMNASDSHKDIENAYNLFQKWMELRTGDVNFVIDYLTSKGVSSDFYSLIDVTRIGVAGHSLGGSAALGVARMRDDINAVLALESPYMCDMTGTLGDSFLWNVEPYSCGVMNLYSDTGFALIESDHKYTQNKNYLYCSKNVEYYHIEGSNHYTLTDLVRSSPILCRIIGGSYEKPGYATLKVINEKSVTFFDKYLKE
jgi:dienelactone hydrolase